MVRSFETSDSHSAAHLRPLRVATRKEHVYGEARNLVEDLPGWSLVSADDETCTLTCRRAAGFLAAEATVTIRVEGPDGIPSCTVHVRSQSEGGLRARDRAVVAEFLRPFSRRVG